MLTAFVSQPRSGYGYSSVGSATIARCVLGWMGPQAGRAPLVSTCPSTVGLSMEELSQTGSDSWDFPNWECGVTAGTNGSDGWDTVGTTGNDSWENGTTGKMEPATVFIDGAALPATGHGRQAPTGCPTAAQCVLFFAQPCRTVVAATSPNPTCRPTGCPINCSGAPSTAALNSLPLCHPGAHHDVSDRVAELHWVH